MKKYCPPHLMMNCNAATKGSDITSMTASFFTRSLKKKPRVCRINKS